MNESRRCSSHKRRPWEGSPAFAPWKGAPQLSFNCTLTQATPGLTSFLLEHPDRRCPWVGGGGQSSFRRLPTLALRAAERAAASSPWPPPSLRPPASLSGVSRGFVLPTEEALARMYSSKALTQTSQSAQEEKKKAGERGARAARFPSTRGWVDAAPAACAWPPSRRHPG